jgi:hypothetical protein
VIVEGEISEVHDISHLHPECDNAWLRATGCRAVVNGPESDAGRLQETCGNQKSASILRLVGRLERSAWAICLGLAGRLQ